MYDPILGAIELMGADEFDLMGDDDDELGAARRRFRMPATRNRRMQARAALKKTLVPQTPGVPAAGAREFPLGFGTFSFTSTSGTATTLTARPQRPFKGIRLVVSVARTGATATGLVTVTSLNVGQNNQLVSAQNLPAEAFAPGAFQTGLNLDPATPGIDITLGLGITVAPGVGDQVDVSALLIGLAIG